MLRVLVVDDEKDTRDKMIHSIDKEQNGLTIVGAASDGYEALDQIVSLCPDIVLIDIEMPGLNGLEVIQKIRDANLPVKFIIISSYSNFAYAQNALRLNVHEYLLKPFLLSEICDAVYRAAEQIYATEDAFSLMFPSLLHKKSARLNGLRSTIAYPFEEETVLLKALQIGKPRDEISACFFHFSEAVSLRNSEDQAKVICFTILYVELHRMVIGLGGKLNGEFTNALSTATDSTNILNTLSAAILQLCFKISAYFADSVPVSAMISSAIQYIELNYMRDLSLAEVSEHVGVSACYLSNQFSQTLNIHFTDYIHKTRIEHAKHLLAEHPQLKGYEIAEMVGYHSPKYFSQQFKKITGMTLTQFCCAEDTSAT